MKKKDKEPVADRFRYEEAEKILDTFVKEVELKEKKSFMRSYRKLKFMVMAYACCDYGSYGVSKEQAIAWAWEDLEIAFRGYGEAAMTGPILQLWTIVGKKSKAAKEFHKALERAFKAANDATSLDVPRRYLSNYREKPMRLGEDDFLLPAILPNWGPTLRDWAEGNGEDPNESEEYYFWIEKADRQLIEEELSEAPEAPAEEEAPKVTLQILDGGKAEALKARRAKDLQDRKGKDA